MVADKIKKARTEAEFTQEQAAEKLMVSRQTVSNWENGKSLPDIVSIIRMSEIYGMSLDELLKGDKVLMEKIEKDMAIVKTQKKFINFALISVGVGVIMFILGMLFEGNPVVDFVNGALPWVLLAITYLIVIMFLNKEEQKS